ncbi:Conserved_hypothetical protein [Hexamita inflata]|uniref:Uncharacterized protein n=1 Tax=Hexamita inflata TaxID=28002 RepID=A0AA86VT89_9EUKA|nr:Conserved hypothetical protein [Hexamita inflata]
MDSSEDSYYSVKSEEQLVHNMFTHKLLPYTDLYIMLFRHQLLIQDKQQQNVVTYLQEDIFDIRELGHLFKPILHEGQLFYKFDSSIYVLNNNEIEKADESYNTFDVVDEESSSSSAFMSFLSDVCALFSFNGKLYTKQLDKLYVKEKNGFVFVKECEGFFVQFCDKVLVLSENGIFKLNDDLSLQLISQVQQQMSLSCGCHVVTYNNEQVHIFDMITETTNIVEFDEKFKQEKIYEVVELGCTGLQLKTEILAEVFGAEYPQQLKQYWDNYMNKHCEQYPIYLETVKNLIPFSQLCQHYNEKYRQKAELYQRSFETRQFMHREKQTRVVNALSTLSQLLNQASNCLANISQVESYQ